MTSAEFMVSCVKKFGWFGIGNIFIDNGLVVNPFTVYGTVCYSESAEQLFTTGKYDTENTGVLQEHYLVTPPKFVGFQQTIVCVQFASIQHIDVHMFSQSYFFDMKAENPVYPTPKIPSEEFALSLAKDEETGLYDNTDTYTRMDGNDISTLNIYPGRSEYDYTGIRAESYRQFIKNQRAFANAVNEYFGLTDCK